MRKIFGVLAGLALSAVCVSGTAAQTLSVNGGTTVVKASNAAAKDKETLAQLQQAAKAGDLRALLRIGELFETGTILPKDPLRACQVYSIAVEHFDKVDRYDAGAALVARAFRLAAKCFAEPPGGWTRNVDMAVALYLHAGITLRDPAATFELARIYLSGEAIPKNSAIAINMLQNAARKQYAPAQALLGSLMWQGKGIPQDKARGLALLMVGLEHAPSEYRDLVKILFDEAMMAASKQEEREARLWVEKYKATHADPSKNQVPTNSVDPVPAPPKSPMRDLRELQEFVGQMDRFANTPTSEFVPPSEATGTTQQKK